MHDGFARAIYDLTHTLKQCMLAELNLKNVCTTIVPLSQRTPITVQAMFVICSGFIYTCLFAAGNWRESSGFHIKPGVKETEELQRKELERLLESPNNEKQKEASFFGLKF